MKYKIEKKVPLPIARKGRFLSPYPFSEMRVGDSFFVHAMRRTRQRMIATKVSRAFVYHQRRQGNGKKWAVRMVTRGVRCWRIK